MISDKTERIYMQLRLNRRTFLEKSLTALAGSSLLGVGSCSNGTGSSSGIIPLRLEFWGTTERDQRTRKVMTLYEQRYPSIKMTSQFLEYRAYWTKLATYLPLFVQKGILLDLTASVNHSLDLRDFDQELLTGSLVNRRLYGLPLGGNYQASFYRKDLLAQAGVAAPDGSMTWEEFAHYCVRIANALGKETWGTEDGSNNAILFEVFIRQRNKEMYTTGGHLGCSAQDLIDWWTYWQELRQAGGCVPPDLGVGVPSTNIITPAHSLLLTGRVAFHFDWSNLIVAWQQFSPHPLGMAVFPQEPSYSASGHYFKVSQLMSIWSHSRHPVEATRFLDFLLTDAGAIKALDIERGVPGSARARHLLLPQLTAVQQEELAYLSLVKKYARPKTVLDPPGSAQVWNLFDLYATKVAFGQLSVSAGAQQFLAEANTALTQAAPAKGTRASVPADSSDARYFM